jgi:branched-chain amino acid transport system permease protein
MANPFSRLGQVFGRVPRWAYVVAALAFAIIFPLLEYFGLMQTLWLRLGTRTLVYVLLAVGLNLVLGETGLLHLGYVAFFAVGAYSTAILSSPRFDLQWNFWVIMAVAMLLAMLFGFVIGAPSLRLRGDYLAIVTLAFGEIVRMTLNNWEALTNGPGGIPGIHPPVIFGWVVDQPAEFYYVLLVAVVIIVALLSNLKNSRIGRAWNALREDEIASHHSGVHPTQAKMLAMVMSSGVAGLAGAIFAYYQQFINPTYFLFMQSVIVVCMVVLGGMGSIPGAILGAVVLDATPEVIRQTFTTWLPNALGSDFMPAVQSALQTDFDRYRMLIFGFVIVLMVIFRPEGLLPNQLWRREVHEEDPRELEQTRQHLFDFEEGRQDLEV